MRIKEIIVVEGRDDTLAIRRAVQAETIETHGFGIRAATWDLIKNAYETCGIIVFTDPDHSGEEIRRQVAKRFPNAKHAFIDRSKAIEGTDIGVENAKPEDVIEALEKAHATGVEVHSDHEWSTAELAQLGLAGGPGSSETRRALGQELGIGYANANTFARRLNAFGITEEVFANALKKVTKQEG